MANDYFGDAIVYEGQSKSSKLIRRFTKSPFTHCALRVDEHTAVAVDWDIMDGSQIMIHDLRNPLKIYLSYEIYRPKGITLHQRFVLEILDKEIPKKYDSELIIKLAREKLLPKGVSVESLAKNGVFSCSSRMAFMYEGLRYKIKEGVDFSRTQPDHFRESPDFEKIGEWIRGSESSLYLQGPRINLQS